MDTDFIKNIKRILPLPESDLVDFLSKFKTIHLKKGEYFINRRAIKKGIRFNCKRLYVLLLQ